MLRIQDSHTRRPASTSNNTPYRDGTEAIRALIPSSGERVWVILQVSYRVDC